MNIISGLNELPENHRHVYEIKAGRIVAESRPMSDLIRTAVERLLDADKAA